MCLGSQMALDIVTGSWFSLPLFSLFFTISSQQLRSKSPTQGGHLFTPSYICIYIIYLLPSNLYRFYTELVIQRFDSYYCHTELVRDPTLHTLTLGLEVFCATPKLKTLELLSSGWAVVISATRIDTTGLVPKLLGRMSELPSFYFVEGSHMRLLPPSAEKWWLASERNLPMLHLHTHLQQQALAPLLCLR